MPSDAVSFSRRAQPEELPEWMDEPCTYEEFRACLVDLAEVNRVTLAARPTMRWLAEHLRAGGAPLHLVDVGCGGGDTLRRIARWATRKGIAVKLTGVDLNPYAARAAREFGDAGDGIEYVTADAYTYRADSGVDLIVSSLFTHHLPDEEVVRFLRWMESTARCGWFVNDLRRSRVSHGLFRALAGVMRWDRMVQHDGPVSILRSFQEDDWRRLCTAAGLPQAAVQIERRLPWRLCVGRWK